MNEKKFEDMDKKLMDAMKTLREKEISEGILKGFSASVERRILARKQVGAPRRFLSPAWAPVLAVMVLASLVVLRLPNTPAPNPVQTMEYARLDPKAAADLEEDIAALKELGVWDENDDSLLANSDEAMAQELELSSGPSEGQANIA